ncbi:HNH endonuclease [Micromonospora sp. NPDC020750]|uniref:HNH endonuclease n=1 Tax=unclassified Micromonospora TaxID=2617518 RepID=UPI0037B2D04D
MSQSWAGGSTRAWRVLRAQVLLRDHYRCRAHDDGWCDRAPGPHTCTGIADLTGPDRGHAHHTLGKAVTGDDPRHIVAACEPCNLHIGDPARHNDPPNKAVTRW